MHAHDERGFDLYETHPVATRALLAHEDFPRRIWEPCAGRGAIVRVLREAGHLVAASDLVEYRIPGQASGRDFLNEKRAPPYCRAVITNPPFQLAAQFAEHALALVPRVAMLMRLAFLEAGNEKSLNGRARLKVLDGGKLARVLVFRNRLPMMHRDGWSGNRTTSATAYAWFIWEAKHRGATKLKRISWVA
jgi:hypothetical protein